MIVKGALRAYVISMDKFEHGEIMIRMENEMTAHIHSKASTAAPLKFVMDKKSDPIQYNGYNYSSMLALKWNPRWHNA